MSRYLQDVTLQLLQLEQSGPCVTARPDRSCRLAQALQPTSSSNPLVLSFSFPVSITFFYSRTCERSRTFFQQILDISISVQRPVQRSTEFATPYLSEVATRSATHREPRAEPPRTCARHWLQLSEHFATRGEAHHQTRRVFVPNSISITLLIEPHPYPHPRNNHVGFDGRRRRLRGQGP